ncbi:MAG: flagellar biosynthesis anti-sigma factor FlgM [Pseudomonadales bacterium]|nr:flagellar biosynthesis anti-sigma factor FlgM [Pseudomonadales bacterium]
MAIDFNKPSTKNSTSIGTRPTARANANKSASPEAVAPEKAASSGAAASGEQVAISSGAQRIQSLEAQIQQLPEVDAARVEAIKQSIADGEYKVDAQSTADKMIAFEESMNRLSNKE